MWCVCADFVLCMLQNVPPLLSAQGRKWHASRRRHRLQRMEEEGVVPRRRGANRRRVDVESQPKPEHEQEYDDMDVQQQQMEEEEELQEELETMDEDGEDDKPRRRRRGKRPMVPDPEPLDDYPGGPHDTTLLWRYHVHVARKASEGEVFVKYKFSLIRY